MKYCMPESDHEEADTRMILHLDEALSQGFKYIGILCVDTDILIILLGVFDRLRAAYDFRDVVSEDTQNKESIFCNLVIHSFLVD